MESIDDIDFELLDVSDVDDINQNIESLSSSQIAKIRAWLQPTDYAAISSEYGKHRTSHLEGTGSWIYQTSEYQQWHDRQAGVIWIKGVAGSGKSVVAASLISKLTEQETAPVVYFFFRQIVSANRQPVSMVRDCLSQLLDHCTYLQHVLNDILVQRRTVESVAFTELWRLFVSSVLTFPRIYCVVDALDEMEVGNQEFIEDLLTLGRRRPKAIKVAMTSRPLPRLEQVLRQKCVRQVQLQPKMVSPDVRYYIMHRAGKFPVAEDVRLQLHEKMSTRADGHFLYARLMMDELFNNLQTSTSPEQDLIAALEQLPKPMADMYARMLQDHSRRSQLTQSFQVALLQWITKAERPLRLLELSSLIEAGGGTANYPENKKAMIRHACGPLLEVLQDETVCPIHHSFTEYLYDVGRHQDGETDGGFPVLNDDDAHCSLARGCIKLLKTPWYRMWPESPVISNNQINTTDLARIKTEFAFLDYAANNWYVHLRKSDAFAECLSHEVYDLLANERDRFHAWIDVSFSFQRFGRQRRDIREWTPIHIAAEKGLHLVVEFLVRHGANVDAKAAWQHTPMTLAAMNGHVRTIETLLRLGAQRDVPDSAGLKPLHHAATNNHGSTISILLQSGVDPSTPKTSETPGAWSLSDDPSDSTIGERALLYACLQGHGEAVRAFLPYISIDDVYQALSWACQRTQTQVIIQLLDVPGIDVNRVINSRTLLFLVAEAGDSEPIQHLLAMGADPCVLSSVDHSEKFPRPTHSDRQVNGLTPLHGLVCGGDACGARWDLKELTEGLTLLLDAGVDINSVDFCGWTILHHLLHGTGANKFSDNRRDELAIVLLLLFNRGLSATALTSDGANALTVAAGAVSATVIDLFVDQGLDISQADSRGETPLTAALQRKDLILAQVLLDRGADPNATNPIGDGPLHIFARDVIQRWQSDKQKFLQKLMAVGANVCAPNQDGNSALHLSRFKTEMLGAFIKNGFDLEMKNNRGETVLNLATESQHQALIDAGANASTRDAEGRNILHRIAEHARYTTIVDSIRYFMSLGVAINAVDDFGNSVWHMVARRHFPSDGQLDAILKFLVEAGGSPSTSNHTGITPLHVACCSQPYRSSHSRVLEFLIRHNVEIDAADDDHVRPLHVAAYLNSPAVARLLEAGADLTAMTNEGQTALMIACRMRESDMVCLILDHYQERQILSLVDAVDNQGRSALHYACRSGRPESVAMLLEAGANVRIRDKQGLTPLHVCAEYLKEKDLWKIETPEEENRSTFSAGYLKYITRAEAIRPLRPYTGQGPESQERRRKMYQFRIRQTVRLLIAHGADTSFLISANDQIEHHDPLSLAIDAGCDAMVNELLIIKTKLELSSEASRDSEIEVDKVIRLRRLDTLESRAKAELDRHLRKTVSGKVQPGENNMSLVTELLMEEEEPSIQLLSHLGARFSPTDEQHDSPMTEMARLGFTNLVREYGRCSKDIDLSDRPANNLLLRQMLGAAIDREIPNMGIVKLLVTEFRVDPNEGFQRWNRSACRNLALPIHHLACASHWWQTRALEFLLDQGCEIEARDSAGQTALMIALRSGTHYNLGDVPFSKVIKTLLHRGANVNVVDNNGKSCLNLAADRPELFKLLLQHGADLSCGQRLSLSNAVLQQNVETLRLLLEAEVDVNQHPQIASAESQNSANHGNSTLHSFPHLRENHTVHNSDVLLAHGYPLHIAASAAFNCTGKYALAVQIIEELLKAGADPYLEYNNNISILHVLAEQGGILEPFINANAYDLERRDYRGRTVLLAACDFKHRYSYGPGYVWNPSILIEAGASINAVDDQGRNALHCLVDAHSGRLPLRDRVISPPIFSMAEEFLSALVAKPDNQGRTALHYALSQSHFDLIDLLVAQGGDIATLDPKDGTSALHHLAGGLTSYADILVWENRVLMADDLPPQPFLKKGHPGDYCRKYILDRNIVDVAELERRDLRSACRHFESLLAQGLFINAQDDSGETPLHKFSAAGLTFERSLWAIKGSISPILKLFEKAGADCTIRDRTGASALHKLAACPAVGSWPWQKDNTRADLQKIATWLLERGADATWEDTDSRTCLDIAAASGAEWMLDMFKRE